VKVLVTGANGFVGGWLVRGLLGAGHDVVGATGREQGPAILTPAERDRVEWLAFDLGDQASVARLVDRDCDALVHLAGLASVSRSYRDPVATWQVNAVGTVRLVTALAGTRAARGGDPVVLVVSTAEVYGPGPARLRHEDDPVAPVSPYAASKAAAELAALELWRRTGLRVVIARPFPHTGPGQLPHFVVPSLIARLRVAQAAGAPVVKTGNLEPVRDLLDVRDVVDAYLALLTRGEPGAVYNVATGSGLGLGALFDRIAGLLGHRAIPELDAGLARPADIPHLVGDAHRLRSATGWSPRFTLDETLQQMIDA
jgi:GDP-4-dehydro-6-deoxy-D-mannose reductase